MNRTAAALLAILTLACGEDPIPQPPTVCGTVDDIELNIRDRITVEPCFSDPEMAMLALTAASSDSAVVFPFVDAQDDVVVTGRSIGEATITVTAMDPDSLDVTLAFKASVLDYPLYLDDDFSENSGMWDHGDGVLVHDGVMSLWATETDSLGGFSRAVHELEDETMTWRASASAMFAHDTVVAVFQLQTSGALGSRFQGYGLLLGHLTVSDQTTTYPANWIAVVYDVQGPSGEGWYLYEYEWFGEHAGIATGDFTDIEVTGVNASEVVFKLNGDVVTTFSENFTTSEGVEDVVLRMLTAPGFGGVEPCPNGTCVDVRFDWVQVRGLQGEEPSARSHTATDRQLTPLSIGAKSKMKFD